MALCDILKNEPEFSFFGQESSNIFFNCGETQFDNKLLDAPPYPNVS